MIKNADQRVDELLKSLDDYCEGTIEELGLPIDAARDELREIVYRWLYANGVAFSIEVRTLGATEGQNP